MKLHSVGAIPRAIYALMFGKTSVRVRYLVILMQYFKARGHIKLSRFCSGLLERYGVYISEKSTIGKGLRLPHPTSIVIGEGVEIGADVTIYQSVTLGGRAIGDWKLGNYPKISDGCVIFAGSVIVGMVSVGQNCVIGANSVVISDIPDNSVAVGAPARTVKNPQSISKNEL